MKFLKFHLTGSGAEILINPDHVQTLESITARDGNVATAIGIHGQYVHVYGNRDDVARRFEHDLEALGNYTRGYETFTEQKFEVDYQKARELLAELIKGSNYD